MKKILTVFLSLTLLAMLILPAAAEAGRFKAKNGVCFEITQKNLINKYYVIYWCQDCDCLKKNVFAKGFQSMAEAMDYLEIKYGEIIPQ